MTGLVEHPDDALIEGILAPLHALEPAARQRAQPLDELLVARILAPLRDLAPAVRGARYAAFAPSRWVGRPRRLAIIGAALVAATAGVGSALEAFVSRPATISPVSPGEPFACAGLIGAPAARAAAFFADRGLAVSWRVTYYGDPGGGLGLGEVSTPSRPPPGSVVEDLVLGPPGTVIVFLQEPGSPSEPLPAPPDCAPPSGGGGGGP
jgi:hypothetical protein